MTKPLVGENEGFQKSLLSAAGAGRYQLPMIDNSSTQNALNGQHHSSNPNGVSSLGAKAIQPFNRYEDFLTAVCFNPHVMRELRDNPKYRGFSLAQTNAPEWACLLWEILVQFDESPEPGTQTLEDAVESELRALAGIARDEDARQALEWFADRKTFTSYKDAAQVARSHIEKWTRPNRFPRTKLRDALNRPRLEYLVYGMFIERGTGVVHSKYGGYKSFIFGVDLALSVALGRPFHGKRVKRKSVVYIIAEGFYETEARVKAYLQFHGIEDIPDNLEIIEMPVQIANERDVADLIEELRDFAPGLVIIDTLAKCNVGRDENSTADMGLFTNGMETIARELNAFVLAIHHNNKMGDMRGSVSLPANVDASITMKPSLNRIVAIECDRVKGAPFESFSLVGRVVELPERDEMGNNITSLVFEQTDVSSPIEPPATGEDSRAKVMNVFRELLSEMPQGVPAKRWEVEAIAQGVPRTTFQRHRNALRAEGEVILEGDRFNLKKEAE